MKPAIVKRVLNRLNLLDYHFSALSAFIQLWVFLFSYWKNHFGAFVVYFLEPFLGYPFLLFLISHSLGWVNSAYGHSSHEWPRAITAPWNGVYSQKFWTLNGLPCAQFDCGIFPRQDVRVPVFWISYCAHIVILMQVCLLQKKTLRTFHHCHFSLSV